MNPRSIRDRTEIRSRIVLSAIAWRPWTDSPSPIRSEVRASARLQSRSPRASVSSQMLVGAVVAVTSAMSSRVTSSRSPTNATALSTSAPNLLRSYPTADTNPSAASTLTCFPRSPNIRRTTAGNSRFSSLRSTTPPKPSTDLYSRVFFANFAPASASTVDGEGFWM